MGKALDDWWRQRRQSTPIPPDAADAP
jgi:hypothetical protein